MQSCTASTDAGGTKARLPPESGVPFSACENCSSPLSPSCSLRATTCSREKSSGEEEGEDSLHSDLTTGLAGSTYGNFNRSDTNSSDAKNDSGTGSNIWFSDSDSIYSTTTAAHNESSAIHSSSSSTDDLSHVNFCSVHATRSIAQTNSGKLEGKFSASNEMSLSAGQAAGRDDWIRRSGSPVISLGGAPAHRKSRREGLLLFCSTENCSNKADDSRNRGQNNTDAASEDSVQPRNFFPFDSILSATGWGSCGGWFFSSSGFFASAAESSSDVTAPATGSATERAPAGVYLHRFAAVAHCPEVLPPLLSIGKAAAKHESIVAGQQKVQLDKGTLNSSVLKNTVLLPSSWQRQQRRHGEQARIKLKPRRVSTVTRCPLSSKSTVWQERNSVSKLLHGSGEGLLSSPLLTSFSLLTKSVGNALWNCFCKLVRSRVSLLSSSIAAAAVAASTAVKRMKRIPKASCFFKDKVIGLAVQDFSVGDVVRRWVSSVILLSEQHAGDESPVVLRPLGRRRSRYATAAAGASTRGSPEDYHSPQNGVAFASVSRCAAAGSCASASTKPAAAAAAAVYTADAHVFITPEAARLLWRSACSLILNPLTALYFQCYRLASLGTVVYVTSVVHWWQPQLGIRRSLDVVTVCVVSGVHFVVACVHAAPFVLFVYILLSCAAITCYLLGCSLSFQGFHREAALCHIGLHSLGTVANLLLYYTIAV